MVEGGRWCRSQWGGGLADPCPPRPYGPSPLVGGFLHSSYAILHCIGSLGVADFWSCGPPIHVHSIYIFHLEKTHFSANGPKCLRVCFVDVHLDWVPLEITLGWWASQHLTYDRLTLGIGPLAPRSTRFTSCTKHSMYMWNLLL
jgi:hypothetical protein